MTGFTCACGDKCRHENGWYVRFRYFFGMFTKSAFVCSDCGEVIYKEHPMQERIDFMMRYM